ncbi:MAG: ribonuclease HII [Caldisericaceae bacterium]
MEKILKVGVDEVGRGPLAGPVVSAAVAITTKIEGIKDSKKLSPKKRLSLFYEIINKAVSVGVGVATVEEIDKLNILNATLLSMKRALESFEISLKNKESGSYSIFVLVDGNKKINDIPFKQKTVVSGDSFIYEISCASIVAKVYRDWIMDSLADVFPHYGFEKNKGYGTKEHFKAIETHGKTPIHREKFLRKLYSEKLFG